MQIFLFTWIFIFGVGLKKWRLVIQAWTSALSTCFVHIMRSVELHNVCVKHSPSATFTHSFFHSSPVEMIHVQSSPTLTHTTSCSNSEPSAPTMLEAGPVRSYDSCSVAHEAKWVWETGYKMTRIFPRSFHTVRPHSSKSISISSNSTFPAMMAARRASTLETPVSQTVIQFSPLLTWMWIKWFNHAVLQTFQMSSDWRDQILKVKRITLRRHFWRLDPNAAACKLTTFFSLLHFIFGKLLLPWVELTSDKMIGDQRPLSRRYLMQETQNEVLRRQRHRELLLLSDHKHRVQYSEELHQHNLCGMNICICRNQTLRHKRMKIFYFIQSRFNLQIAEKYIEIWNTDC